MRPIAESLIFFLFLLLVSAPAALAAADPAWVATCESDKKKLEEDDQKIQKAIEACELYQESYKSLKDRACKSLVDGNCGELKTQKEGFKKRGEMKAAACMKILMGITPEQCSTYEGITDAAIKKCEADVRARAEEYNSTHARIVAEDKAAREKVESMIAALKGGEEKIAKCIEAEKKRCEVDFCCPNSTRSACNLPVDVPLVTPIRSPDLDQSNSLEQTRLQFVDFSENAAGLRNIGVDHTALLTKGSAATTQLEQNLARNRERLTSIDSNAPPAQQSTITGDTKPSTLPTGASEKLDSNGTGAPGGAPSGSGNGSGGPTFVTGGGAAGPGRFRPEIAGPNGPEGAKRASTGANPSAENGGTNPASLAPALEQKVTGPAKPLPPKDLMEDTVGSFKAGIPPKGKVMIAGEEERKVRDLMQELQGNLFGGGKKAGDKTEAKHSSEATSGGKAEEKTSEKGTVLEKLKNAKGGRGEEEIKAAAKEALAQLEKKYGGVLSFGGASGKAGGIEQEQSNAPEPGLSVSLSSISLFERVKIAHLRCHAVGCVYYSGED